MDELERITGVDPRGAYAKACLWHVLDQMRDRYGNDATSDALTEVYGEIYGYNCCAGDDDADD